MRKLLLAGALAFTPITYADTFAGVYVGAQYWDMEANGAFGTTDVLQTFDLDDESKGSAWIAFEHIIPVIPNVKLRYNQLDTDGSADVVDFEFGGNVYTGRADLESELDHVDIIMYYEIFDNSLFSLDLGANLKYGDYKVNISGELSDGDNVADLGTSSESYSGVIPLIYAYSELNVPGTGLGVFGDISWIGYDGDEAYDVQFGAKYSFLDNFLVDLDIQVGYRKILIDLDDYSDLYIDAEFDGYFAGMQFHF